MAFASDRERIEIDFNRRMTATFSRRRYMQKRLRKFLPSSRNSLKPKLTLIEFRRPSIIVYDLCSVATWTWLNFHENLYSGYNYLNFVISQVIQFKIIQFVQSIFLLLRIIIYSFFIIKLLDLHVNLHGVSRTRNA